MHVRHRAEEAVALVGQHLLEVAFHGVLPASPVDQVVELAVQVPSRVESGLLDERGLAPVEQALL